jgi:hypothetical protein
MRHHLEHFGSELGSCPVALCGVRHFAGIRLGIGDEILHVIGCNFVWVDDERVRHARHDNDRHELHGIEFKVRIEILIDDQWRRRRSQQGVPVGLGLRYEFGADIAACAGMVLNNDCLAPFARQSIGNDARHDIGGAAGREWHHDLHHACRVFVRARSGS